MDFDFNQLDLDSFAGFMFSRQSRVREVADEIIDQLNCDEDDEYAIDWSLVGYSDLTIAEKEEIKEIVKQNFDFS